MAVSPLERSAASRTRMIGLAAAGAAASASMIWITAHGLGVNADATVYLDTAGSVLAGRGFEAAGQPLTHYPPLFPAVLAGASLLTGRAVFEASRWLQALLFGVNTVLLAATVSRATAGSLWAGLLAVMACCASTPVLTLHSYVWSEPTFLFFSLAGMLLLADHLDRPRLARLVAASLMVGLAMMTRYVGLALLLPLVVGLFALASGPFASRIRDSCVGLLIACAPLGLWLIRNLRLAGSATNRSLVFHPVGVNQARSLVGSLSDFAFPATLPFRLKCLLVGALTATIAAGVIVLYRGRHTCADAIARAGVLPILHAVLALGYLAALVVSFSLFDITTTWDGRILAPVFISAVVALIGAASLTARTRRAPVLWWTAVALSLFAAVVGARGSRAWAMEARRTGQGYASDRWADSTAITFLKSFPATVTIYANDPWAVRFLAGKPAQLIPLEVSPTTDTVNRDYDAQMRSMCSECESQTAVLVWLDKSGPWFKHTREMFEATCHVRVKRDLGDGAIYGGDVLR